jgi:hypothetical protein
MIRWPLCHDGCTNKEEDMPSLQNIETPSLYVGCGLTHAPEEFRDHVGELKNVLSEQYEVFDYIGLEGGTSAEVYRWDIEKCTPGCDLFVGIFDYPSTGLGQELQKRIDIGKPALGLAHSLSKVTRAVTGAADAEEKFNFKRYENLLVDAPKLIALELGALGIMYF